MRDSKPEPAHRPRKRFGQNFLENQGIIQEILRQVNPQPGDRLLEIGPGLGALTLPLLQRLDRLTVVEIDRDLAALLANLPQAGGRLTVIEADALTVDYSSLGRGLRIVGNLPYNISTPLLIRLLTSGAEIDDLHLMLQKEVVDRLTAAPGCKAYGRLSVFAQYHGQVEALFEVPPEAFRPVPKVDSAFVRLIPWHDSPYPKLPQADLEFLVAKAFGMRRKTLANNLKPLFTAAELADLGIDPGLRPEQITVAQYVQLAKFISK